MRLLAQRKNYFLAIVLFLKVLSAQSFEKNDFYNNALHALNNNDTIIAKQLFEKSIRKDENPDAYFELAKILLKNLTPLNSYRAQEYLNRAILINEDDIKYRLKLAEIVKSEHPSYAYKIYNGVIEKDSNSLVAWNELSKIKEIQCREMSRVADADFNHHLSPIESSDIYQETLHAIKKIVSIDENNPEAQIRLSRLYSYAGEYNKAIRILKQVVKNDPLNSEALLFLGFLYNRKNKLDKAWQSYTKALAVLNEKDRRIFTNESIHEIFIDDLQRKFGLEDNDSTKKFVGSYLRSKDPLYLTDYNERLLEHFNRMVYSNLHFSVPKMNIKGWQTDRGEIFLRYGYPIKIERLKSTIDITDFKSYDFDPLEYPKVTALGNASAKAETWYYNDLELSFQNLFMNSNFFVFNSAPPFLGSTGRFAPKSPSSHDTEYIVEGGLRTLRPEEFNPNFEGPTLKIDYNTYQLKNLESNKTDIYVNYAIDDKDGIVYNSKFAYKHDYGVFLFDDLFNPVFEGKGSLPSLEFDNRIAIDSSHNVIVNTASLSIKDYSENLAFELIRTRDKGVFADKKKFRVSDFSGDSLNISDIILAANINNIESEGSTIKRNGIEILPNPINTFSDQTPLYIYYEVYNLELYEDNLTNFKQEVILKEYEEESGGVGNIVDAFFGAIGINEEEKKITLSSNFRTQERNPQIYFKLDMSMNEPGKYEIEVKIIDNLTNRNINKSAILHWR